MNASPPIRLGTRASRLARWQADWVAEQLRSTGTAVEIVLISTRGDQHKSGPIAELGGTGLFTKEIQRALLDGRIDLAVHSLKDLPTESVEGLALACVPPRERCGDALIGRTAATLDQLAPGAIVGTGSPRRAAQILHVRPDLTVSDVRGNVETRLRKLDDGAWDALILAEAGLVRLGLADRITQVLPKQQVLPAPGQGALGLEIRADDHGAQAAVAPLDDAATHQAVVAERTLLAVLRGGCLAPVGTWARSTDDGQLQLDAVVLDRTGEHRLTATAIGPPKGAATIGTRVAEALFAQGAAALIHPNETS